MPQLAGPNKTVDQMLRACRKGILYGMAAVTTMKITTATRIRLRSLGSKVICWRTSSSPRSMVTSCSSFGPRLESASAAETAEQRGRRQRVEAEVEAGMDRICVDPAAGEIWLADRGDERRRLRSMYPMTGFNGSPNGRS